MKTEKEIRDQLETLDRKYKQANLKRDFRTASEFTVARFTVSWILNEVTSTPDKFITQFKTKVR